MRGKKLQVSCLSLLEWCLWIRMALSASLQPRVLIRKVESLAAERGARILPVEPDKQRCLIIHAGLPLHKACYLGSEHSIQVGQAKSGASSDQFGQPI